MLNFVPEEERANENTTISDANHDDWDESREPIAWKENVNLCNIKWGRWISIL